MVKNKNHNLFCYRHVILVIFFLLFSYFCILFPQNEFIYESFISFLGCFTCNVFSCFILTALYIIAIKGKFKSLYEIYYVLNITYLINKI